MVQLKLTIHSPEHEYGVLVQDHLKSILSQSYASAPTKTQNTFGMLLGAACKNQSRVSGNLKLLSTSISSYLLTYLTSLRVVSIMAATVIIYDNNHAPEHGLEPDPTSLS
jgi:hypothetical protein